MDDAGGVHYGDRVPDAQKGKAKPLSGAPGPTDTERAAAEARRAHDRTLDEAGRKGRAEVAQKTPTPAPGAAGTNAKPTCEQEWQRYEQSDACFAPFRNATGGIQAEAFKHCTEVSMPKCTRPARR